MMLYNGRVTAHEVTLFISQANKVRTSEGRWYCLMLCFLVAVAYLIKEIINLVDEHYESIKLIVDCVSLAVEIYVILHSRKKKN